jgi:hypothetical protein
MRLAGIALGGYYPTPASLAPALAARLRADTPQVFLDPCAGDGAAVADLATAMIPRLTPEAVKLRDRVRATGGYGGATALPDGLDDAEDTRVSRAWDARDCTFALVELERDRAAAIRTTFSPVAGHDRLTVTAADAFAVWHKPSGYRFPRALRAGILAVLGADPGTRPGAEDDARDEALPGRVAAALTDTAVDMASRRGALPFASVLYLNPPYDLDAVHGRLEQRFLRRFTGSLRPGGVLVFLVPHHALRASAEFIATHYRDVRCLRFPPEHFAAYRQVVLYGVRRGGSGLDIDGPQGAEGDGAPGLRPDPVVLARILAWADAEPGPEGLGLPECPELTPGLAPGEAPYTLPRYTFDSKHGSYNAAMKWAGAWDVPSVHGRIEAVDVPHIRAFFDPWSSRRKGGAAVSAQAAYGALTGRGDPIAGILPPSLADVLQRDYPVVMPPKPAHIAAGIAAGVFNGEALAPDGGPGEGPTLLVKGAFRREFATISTRENKDGQVVAEERVQQPSLVVTVCDLANGEYHTLASSPTATLPEGPFTSADVAGMSVGDLLTRYGRGLLATLRARCPVLYDPRTADAEGAGADGYTGAAWTLPPTRRPPYPAQTHAIRAMVKVLAAGPVRRDGARGATVPYRGRRGATVALLGEVGCGKSLVSLVAAMALGARRILVLCPPHLLDGWREQVALTCHHATVHVLRSPAEVDAWATERPEDLYPEGVPADAVSIGILSREAAKLGHGVEGVGRCPDCGFDSHGGAASRVLAAALSEAEKDTALAANAGAHAARIAQALAASRPGGGGVEAGGGDAARVAEGIEGAVAVLEGKRAARIQRLTDTRDDEEAEERNARLRVLCPAPLPLRPRDRIASALGALAMALGRWDTGLREYASSAALLRAWTRLDAENHVAILATVAGADEADRAGALTRADKEQRTAGGRATLDAPGPAYGRATPAPVSATHRALGLAVEAMALAYAERGSTWGGSTPGAPRVDDVWLALALLPDSVRLDVVVGLQRRLAPAPVIRANGELTHRCPWGRAWDTRNTAWIMAHVLAWSALLCASREVADEIAWTWPGYPGTRADAPDHDPRVALPKRETARVLLPHASTSWAMKAPTNGGGDDPEGAVHGDLHVGPCAWRDVSAGDAPASMRLAAVRLMVRAHTPAPSRVRNAYGYGASSPESTTPSEASITLAGTWRRVRAFLTTAARWAPAPVGTPVDARLYDPGALVTGDDAGRLPAVTAPRLARVMARLRRGAADAGDAGADAAVGDDGAGTEGGKGRTRGRGAATATGRKARPGRCNAALYQASPEPRRAALARYIVRRHPGCFDFLVADEAHEFAGDRTAQFMAFQRLAGLGAPTILATGSVMNGYAESLFNLWQRFPEFRAEFPREARRAFVERYGYIRVEVKDVDKDTGKVVEFGSVSDRVVRQTREVGNAPGVLPLFILRHLLPRAVTLHKTDLALSLPPCHQRVAFVPVDPDAAKLHAAMLSALVAEVTRGRFQPGLAGKLFGMLSESPSHLDRCTADVGNRPDGAYVVAYPESAGPNAGALVWNGEALDPRRVLAKEAWLLRTIRREVAEGRRVLVLAWHVELMPRLQRLIAHCLADVLAPEEYGAPELPGGFAWRGPVGGGGDAPEGVDPIDEVPAGYWSGLDAATGLPLPGPAAGGTGAGPGGATKGRGKGTGGGAGAGSTTGPTLAAAARGKGARGGARPVFPTSLPAAAIDRLCPALNAGKVAAADRIAWINERVVRTGAKVMVVQPVAVKTGINNLVHFSTQVWMQNPGCDATTLRQAVGRVDRIGQGADETRIYLGVYAVRSQRAAHTLLMRKAAVALAADGLDGESALNAAGVGESAGAMSALTVGRQLYDLIAADG